VGNNVVSHLDVTHPTSRPTIQWTLGVKWLAREADLSSPPPHQVQVSRLRVSIIIQIISHKLSGFSQGQLYIGACLSTWYTGDKRFTANVWFTVHRHSVWIRNQLDVTFVLSFISLLQVAQHVSGNHVPIFRS